MALPPAEERRLGHTADGARIDLLAHVLPAVFPLLLPLVGARGLAALMATCADAARDVPANAAELKLSEPGLPVHPARAAAWAARFRNARALTVSASAGGGSAFALATSAAAAAAAAAPVAPEVVLAALAAAAALPQLEELDLAQLPLADGDGACARALAAAVRAAPRLQSLRLDHCAIGERGAAALAAALRAGAAPRLARLRLAGNFVASEGVRVLTEAPLPAALRTLDLRHNEIGAAGAGAIAAALPRLRRLERLLLSDNDLGGSGARSLAAVLPRMQRLAALHAHRCNLGDAARGELRAAAPPSLRELLL